MSRDKAFCVVQFIELPFEGIDDYVCVPHSWVIVRLNQKAAVAYPKDENPFDTRDRVKTKERHDDEWKYYMATIKYESDTYRDAEYWIATRNDYGPLVEEESERAHTRPRLTFNKEMRSANRSHSSKSNDNPRNLLLRNKRSALSEPKKQHDGKRLKLAEAAQSSSAFVNDANVEPGQRQSQPNQQDSLRPLQGMKLRIDISVKPKNNRQMSTLQKQPANISLFRDSTKKTPLPNQIKVLRSLRQAISTAIDSNLNVRDNSFQTDDCRVKEPLSPYHAVTSDSNAVTDQEVISDHDMSPDEAPVTTTNNVYSTGIAFGRSSADRPTIDQNSTSTNHQTHPRAVLEQQMLDNFATLFTQMGSTLRYTCDMYNNLRSSILETAETYKTLLKVVERFKTVANSASNESSLSNVTQEVI